MASIGLVPVFGYALTFLGRRKYRVLCEVAPRGNESFSSRGYYITSIPPSSERLQPKPHPPSNNGFTLVLLSPSPSGVVSKLVKDPSVVIVRGKTIPARWPFFLSLRPRRRSNMMMRTIFARIHCNFRRMFPFRSFFAESELRKNICRIFADSINVVQINISVNQDLREKSTQVYRVKNPNETVTLLGTQRDRTLSEESD